MLNINLLQCTTSLLLIIMSNIFKIIFFTHWTVVPLTWSLNNWRTRLTFSLLRFDRCNTFNVNLYVHHNLHPECNFFNMTYGALQHHILGYCMQYTLSVKLWKPHKLCIISLVEPAISYELEQMYMDKHKRKKKDSKSYLSKNIHT